MNGLVGGPVLVGGLGPRTLGPPLNLALLRVTYTRQCGYKRVISKTTPVARSSQYLRV